MSQSALIVDRYGKPVIREQHPATIRELRAKFDLAQTTVHNRKHWGQADSLAARAAMSPAVRNIVRKRSRYEADNNSWYNGMLTTAANHIVGTGPRLQVLTENTDGNSRLEQAWTDWTRQIQLAEKLRTMVITYWKDGEILAMRTARPRNWPISLDVRLYESEQCASPFYGGRTFDPWVDDGVRTDENSNEVEYYIYDHHPGDVAFVPTLKGEWYKSRDVIHLFRRERPGQVRGIPRCTSSLNVIPIMRRQEMATLLAAETAASFATYLKSTGSAITPAASPADFAELEIAFNMLTTLPEGWDIAQVDPKHPGPQYEMFQRQALMSFARCTNMPYALAAGTSKDSNFSSLKGDMKNVWQPEVTTEQNRLELLVIEQCWAWFLEDAIYVPGLLDGMPPIHQMRHQWYWAPLPNLDEVDSATAANIRLTTGQSCLSQEHAIAGKDFETQLVQMARDFGVTTDVMRKTLLTAHFPQSASMQTQPAAAPSTQPGDMPQQQATVAELAMNGAQVTSIVEIIAQVSAKVLPAATARALIRSAFPAIPPQRIDEMLAPFSVPSAPGVPTVAGVQPAPGFGPEESGGEYTTIGQRDWQNNQKRIRKILDAFVAGEKSEGMTRLDLQSIGLKPGMVQAYIDDAKDGSVSAPELQQVTQ